MSESENSTTITSKQGKLTPDYRKNLINQIIEKLENNYVLEDKIPLYRAKLEQQLTSGVYDLEDPVEFATIVNSDLHEVYPDKHLNFMYINTETGQISAGGGVKVVRRPNNTETKENTPIIRKMGGSPQQSKSRQTRIKMGMDGSGLVKTEILENNIGYMKINLFKQSEEEENERYNSAFQKIQNTNALIIDLRECRGGSPDTIALLSSFLFGPEKVLLAETYFRRDDNTLQRWTSGWEGASYHKKTVFVLVSKSTGSGGESFAYSLQHLKRAPIIGNVTAGAGLMVDFFDLGNYFRLNVSIGRSYDPKTGKGFEFVGVQPDIEVPSDEALDYVLNNLTN